MKKIKSLNGYTIYLANERDAKKYHGVTAGGYYVYFSSDVRDYGLSMSYYEFECDTLEEAVENCGGYIAKAKEALENIYTCVDFDDVLNLADAMEKAAENGDEFDAENADDVNAALNKNDESDDDESDASDDESDADCVPVVFHAADVVTIGADLPEKVLTAKQLAAYKKAMAKHAAGKKTLSATDCGALLTYVYRAFMATGKQRLFVFDILIENAQKIVEKNGRPFSVNECKEYYGLSACSNHTAKMAGMESYSTNTRLNARCEKNCAVDGAICQNCFSRSQMEFFSSMDKPLTINYLLLNYRVLPAEILPVINRQYFRIESFGDVATAKQAINYCNIMTAHSLNRRCDFAAWSKNPDIWRAAFIMRGKPQNLSFGISSLFLNKDYIVPAKYAEYVDFIFTVYESEKAARDAGKTVNCGARHCLTCLNCYNARRTHKTTGAPAHMVELLK